MIERSLVTLADFDTTDEWKSHYDKRKSVTLWCKNYFEKTSQNVYLSLYSSDIANSRSCSIELNSNCVFYGGNLLYRNGNTTLVYYIHNKSVYETLKELWEQWNG